MLLLNSRPLVIIPELATLIGLNEAIIIQQLHYWLEINKKTNKNLIEGRYWTYNTYEDWQNQFPFWSISTIKRTITRLKEAGFIITGNFNQMKLDRTVWYSIDYDQLKKIEKQGEDLDSNQEIDKVAEEETIENLDSSHKVILTQCNSSQCSNRLGQNDPMQEFNLTPPITIDYYIDYHKDNIKSVSPSNMGSTPREKPRETKTTDGQTEDNNFIEDIVNGVVEKYGHEVVKRSLAKIRDIEGKTGKTIGKKGFKKYLEKVCEEQAEILKTIGNRHCEYSDNASKHKRSVKNVFEKKRDLNYLVE